MLQRDKAREAPTPKRWFEYNAPVNPSQRSWSVESSGRAAQLRGPSSARQTAGTSEGPPGGTRHPAACARVILLLGGSRAALPSTKSIKKN